MWREFLLLVVVAVCCGAGQEDSTHLVHLAQGPVRGTKDPDTGVYIYSSIPYATVPTGDQRFQAPLPAPTWTKPIGTDKRIVCPQVSARIKNRVIQDDCLIANVYVSNIHSKNSSVVVFVHGGAFQVGFGDKYPPKYFIKDKNLVAVTFNYRLGINGFLCLGTNGAPGNAGLKDQVALLRWVQKNIAKFGGNPKDVTISGASAGSASVDLLMLSKITSGLFNKVIPESGTCTGVIVIQQNPIELARNVAESLGYESGDDDISALEKFLKGVPVMDFFKGVNPNYENANATFDFVPCVEQITDGEVFLDDAPINIIQNSEYRKVPLLLGFTNMEGLLQLDRFPRFKPLLNKKFSDFLPADLLINDGKKEEVLKEIRDFYFKEEEISDSSILEYVDFMTDVLFAYPVLKSAKLYAESGNNEVYLYEFSYVDEEIPIIPNTNVRGANHCAQTKVVFDERQLLNPGRNFTEKYIKIRSVVQEMWYNFIKTGKPVPDGSSLPKWPRVQPNQTPYMSLDVEVELKRTPPLEERYQFWDNLYSKYYKVPKAPEGLDTVL